MVDKPGRLTRGGGCSKSGDKITSHTPSAASKRSLVAEYLTFRLLHPSRDVSLTMQDPPNVNVVVTFDVEN